MAEMKTPGQIAYEAFWVSLAGECPATDWPTEDGEAHAAWEASAAAVRERLYAELGNEHYVVFTEDEWWTEHSVECRLSGRMHECAHHAAVARVIGCGAPIAGRWRITGISEGLPDLERADG